MDDERNRGVKTVQGDMGRIARIVVPGCPHHVTQRGNRRQKTFFGPEDFQLYKRLIADWCSRKEVKIWAYCLMPNHVHLILQPTTSASLARAVGEAHRRYTLLVNHRERWTGYLWQGRFASFPMDEAHLLRAARYILLNPVRAGLAERPEDWPHSSVQAHLRGRSDGIVAVEPLGSRVKDWGDLLKERNSASEEKRLELHMRTGRPLGGDDFVQRLEKTLGRILRPRRRGRPPRSRGPEERKSPDDGALASQ